MQIRFSQAAVYTDRFEQICAPRETVRGFLRRISIGALDRQQHIVVYLSLDEATQRHDIPAPHITGGSWGHDALEALIWS